MIRLFRRHERRPVRIAWRPAAADQPLIADIRDVETGELLASDTHGRCAEWLRLHGYRPVTGTTGIHIRDVLPASIPTAPPRVGANA